MQHPAGQMFDYESSHYLPRLPFVHYSVPGISAMLALFCETNRASMHWEQGVVYPVSKSDVVKRT